ncbi:MAG TPA: 2-phospho-L-lactate guanylyltransferase [Acidimicrobiales bacterium]|nr:2-phospho-L-lactate guanylyltransferase [Acidimicrobiales bacterium]
MSTAVLMPVKAFAESKARLAPALDPLRRARLARWMAARVMEAAAPLPVFVVCDDQSVAQWAEEAGAGVVWEPGRGLNAAVSEGVRHLERSGFTRAIVAHADLPWAAHLHELDRFPGLTIAPDQRDDGSNVICIPTESRFVFAYGPGSFSRHITEARRLGLAVRIARRTHLAADIDLPSDLGLVST